jgi:hypothetical protein
MTITFDELLSLAIMVFGIISAILIFSDQIAHLISYLTWRQRQTGGGE